jgi:hypothetical protein
LTLGRVEGGAENRKPAPPRPVTNTSCGAVKGAVVAVTVVNRRSVNPGGCGVLSTEEGRQPWLVTDNHPCLSFLLFIGQSRMSRVQTSSKARRARVPGDWTHHRCSYRTGSRLADSVVGRGERPLGSRPSRLSARAPRRWSGWAGRRQRGRVLGSARGSGWAGRRQRGRVRGSTRGSGWAGCRQQGRIPRFTRGSVGWTGRIGPSP